MIIRRAVTYHRVSTLDQDPTLARAELERAATGRGLELVAAVEETGSGALNNRPGLLRVLELVRRRRADVVLVWKLDRFGRSALDVLANVREIEQCGATFACISQPIEVGPDAGPIGRMTLTILAAVAEFERSLIRERTQLGLAAARAAGRKLGRPRGALDRKPRRRRRANLG
jgi:putative DNA-invertase from lambdoid prophage Rac